MRSGGQRCAEVGSGEQRWGNSGEVVRFLEVRRGGSGVERLGVVDVGRGKGRGRDMRGGGERWRVLERLIGVDWS